MNRNMSSKGPGRATRKGLSLVQITKMFPSDEAAEAWFVETRWPDGLQCPHCESPNVATVKSRKPMPYRCRSCRKHFSVRTHTLMQNSRLGYQVWAIAVYLMSTGIKGTAAMKLHGDLGIAYTSAWRLAHKIRETWRDEHPTFTGPVEADESFVGGLEKNKHADKKLRMGGGTVGKLPVAGVMDRATGRVSAAVVPDTTGPTLRHFVRERTAPGALVFTDKARAYQGLPYHQAVDHGIGQWVDGQAHTNGLESFWSLMKRGFHGTYHKMSARHLHRYVREFEGRYNQRSLDTIDQMRAMARGFEGKRLSAADLAA